MSCTLFHSWLAEVRIFLTAAMRAVQSEAE
ncbi:putative signal peptide protein [Puccinia sorghi]|uniref:Putative signal peptide protein n=1 Tax=Puccinia sorghi TaxID=27349 RepID=A0A0L6UMT5_9BASI|nr:putative signal peptide protein [Puccinia sorghi]